MYFIQYTGSLSGESALWWRKDRPGYTIRVDEAGQYTESEARMIERVRGEAKSFPVDVVLGAASRHVVASDLRKATDVAKVTP